MIFLRLPAGALQKLKHLNRLHLLLVILITCALGAFFSVFTLYRQGSVDPQPSYQSREPSITNPSAKGGHSQSEASVATWWRPSLITSWQWQLTTPVDLSVDADMYDIDLFENDASVVQALHAKERKAICYINIGTWEAWRPDAQAYPKNIIGKDYVGWPDEKWLDIRQRTVLAPIIEARLDQCKQKGFDGVEPDNISGYQQDTGFPITAQDQLDFNKWLAGAAHARGLSIGLKQDPDQAEALVADFDWALDEQCFEFSECDKMVSFIQAGKPVFNAEYNLGISDFCNEANERNFNSLRKNIDLDEYRQACR